MKSYKTLAALGIGVFLGAELTAAPNVLLITADDLNCSSVGAYGSKLDGITPNIDQLAREGTRFQHGHVTVAVCQPSRSVWMTGRYPINSGGEAFHKLTKPDVPILPDLLRKGGYRVGVLGKLSHSTPYKEFQWDMQWDRTDLGMGRSPAVYAAQAKTFIKQAAREKKPFFLMANSHDPHRPFYGNDPQKWYAKEGPKPGAVKPSRIYKPADVTVPGFLPDIPLVRREISEYYNSVKRCDDTVGALLKILSDAGQTDNTLVIFLSDNGMAFPFSKTNCYLHSTRTPYIVRWPKSLPTGMVDTLHMVSGIDIAPTILAAAGVKNPGGMDGRSLLPILKGGEEKRDRVFTQFHKTSAKKPFQMRAVQTPRYGYIYNAWANGKTQFRNESMNGRTFKAMKAAARGDKQIAGRVELFLKRVPEELYDFSKDPDGLHNLAMDPQHRDRLAKFRQEILAWMTKHSDPELAGYKAYLKSPVSSNR